MHFFCDAPQEVCISSLAPLGSTAEFVVFQPCLSFEFVAACLKHRSHYTMQSTALLLHNSKLWPSEVWTPPGPLRTKGHRCLLLFFWGGEAVCYWEPDPRWAAAHLHIYLFRFYLGRRAPCRGDNTGNAYCFTCLQTAPSDLPSLPVPWGNVHCNKFIIRIRMI